ALILQILVAVLATHAQVVIPKLKLGVGVGYGVDELHLAAGIGVLFPLQIAGGGAKVVAAVVGDGVVGALVSAQAGLGLGRDGLTRRAITILQTAAGLEVEAIVLVRGQAEHGSAAAHLLFGEAILELILTAMGKLAVQTHPQQPLYQSAGRVGVGLEDVA